MIIVSKSFKIDMFSNLQIKNTKKAWGFDSLLPWVILEVMSLDHKAHFCYYVYDITLNSRYFKM